MTLIETRLAETHRPIRKYSSILVCVKRRIAGDPDFRYFR